MRIQTFSIVAGTHVCNAHCPYCISKMTPNQGINLKEPEVNWRNFDKSSRLAEINKVTTVLITGKGEPTLYPNQITNFLKHLKKFDFPLIELQTNGILLGKTSYNKYLKNWFNLGLTLIAISIVHYKNEKNKEIFQPKEDYMNLENLIAKLHKIGFSVRLSCTLVKNYIDNAPELKKLVEWAKDQKIEQLTIRKLAFPKKSQDPKIRNWTTRNVLDKKHLTNMRKYIEKNGNKIMTLPDGAQIYDVSGQNLCLTDALTLEPKTDNLRQIIFFPEGHLRYDWQFEGAVLI